MTANIPIAYRLKARAKLAEPEECLLHVVEHLKEREGEVQWQAGAFLVSLPDVRGRLWCEEGVLLVDAASNDAETAYFVKSWLDGVFRHAAGTGSVEIDWEENWSAGPLPPSFSTLKVHALQRIAPWMMRITLQCPDAARFDRADALHVQILVNFADLTVATDKERPRLTWRRYTIRAVDLVNNTLDIDIFLHGEAGPGARWAEQLRVGDLVGVSGPSGGGIGTSDHYLIAGDETAVPAISRITRLLPPHCVGEVLIETAEGAKRLPIEMPGGIRLTWLARPRDAVSVLEDAVVRALAHLPAEKTFVWVACEAGVATRLRKYLRTVAQPGKLDHLIAGYWKR